MSPEELKKEVAKAIAAKVKDGDVIGIGSGSTVELAVLAIGDRIKEEGLKVSAIPTSHRIVKLSEEMGIETLSARSSIKPKWAFDGADEVDPQLNLVKGAGAAMLSEKIMAKRAEEFVVVVSEDKLVENLGSKFPVPVEVIPEAKGIVETALGEAGAKEVEVRSGSGKYGPVVTEHGNLILDCKFGKIDESLEGLLKSITGVVETGLFWGYTSKVIVSKPDGIWVKTLEKGEVKENRMENPS